MPASRLLKMFGDHSSNAHMNCKLKEKWLTAGFAETTCLSTVLFHISFPSPYTRTQASSCPVLAIGGHSFIKALSYTRHRLLKRYWRDLKIHLVLLTTDLRVANCSVLRYKISTLQIDSLLQCVCSVKKKKRKKRKGGTRGAAECVTGVLTGDQWSVQCRLTAK